MADEHSIDANHFQPELANLAVCCPTCLAPAASIYPECSAPIVDGGRIFTYFSCGVCEILFCNPVPSKEEIEHLYTHRYDFEWFRKRSFLKWLQAAHRHRRLRKLLSEFGTQEVPRYLDIGCGHGWLVQMAQANGWISTGIDFFDGERIKEAKASGLDLRVSAVEDFSANAGAFTLISMWHSLEHMTDPQRALIKIAGLLSEGGILVIAVPNRNSIGLRKAGATWGWLQKPFIHPYCFSEKSLRLLLPSSLRIVQVTSRDTWDQQVIQCSASFRLSMRFLAAIFRAMCGGLRRAGLRRMVPSFEFVHFLLTEFLLLVTYFAYLCARRLPSIRDGYEKGKLASELMVIARRVQSPEHGFQHFAITQTQQDGAESGGGLASS